MVVKLLHWLYCLDFFDAAALLITCSFLFCLAHNRFAQYRSWKVVVTLFLLTATFGVIYTTLGTRTSGDSLQLDLVPLHSYREVMNGGDPELLRSNFMNAVLFYPIGLLATAMLPKRWPKRRRHALTITICMTMSIGIEYTQYAFSLGRCEIDDVIHNVLGAWVGSIAMLWMQSLAESLSNKVKLIWEQRN